MHRERCAPNGRGARSRIRTLSAIHAPHLAMPLHCTADIPPFGARRVTELRFRSSWPARVIGARRPMVTGGGSFPI